MFIINCLIIIFTKFSPDPSCPRFLVGHPFSDKLDSHLRGNDVLKVQTIMGQLLRQEIEKLSHHFFIHAV